LWVLFVTMYGMTNWLASLRKNRVHLYFDWELGIPFYSNFIWGYFSICILFLVPLFILNKKEINDLGWNIFWATLVAGIFFLLIPTHLGFDRLSSLKQDDLFFRTLYFLDYPHNLFPSLHITYSGIIVFSVLTHVKLIIKWFLWIWLIMICMSVVVVHQHHVMDILGGFILAKSIINLKIQTPDKQG